MEYMKSKKGAEKVMELLIIIIILLFFLFLIMAIVPKRIGRISEVENCPLSIAHCTAEDMCSSKVLLPEYKCENRAQKCCKKTEEEMDGGETGADCEKGDINAYTCYCHNYAEDKDIYKLKARPIKWGGNTVWFSQDCSGPDKITYQGKTREKMTKYCLDVTDFEDLEPIVKAKLAEENIDFLDYEGHYCFNGLIWKIKASDVKTWDYAEVTPPGTEATHYVIEATTENMEADDFVAESHIIFESGEEQSESISVSFANNIITALIPVDFFTTWLTEAGTHEIKYKITSTLSNGMTVESEWKELPDLKVDDSDEVTDDETVTAPSEETIGVDPDRIRKIILRENVSDIPGLTDASVVTTAKVEVSIMYLDGTELKESTKYIFTGFNREPNNVEYIIATIGNTPATDAEFIDLVKDKLENNAYTIPDKDGTWIVLSYQFTVIKDNGEFVGDVRTHSIKKQGDTE